MYFKTKSLLTLLWRSSDNIFQKCILRGHKATATPGHFHGFSLDFETFLLTAILLDNWDPRQDQREGQERNTKESLQMLVESHTFKRPTVRHKKLEALHTLSLLTNLLFLKVTNKQMVTFNALKTGKLWDFQTTYSLITLVSS